MNEIHDGEGILFTNIFFALMYARKYPITVPFFYAERTYTPKGPLELRRLVWQFLRLAPH